MEESKMKFRKKIRFTQVPNNLIDDPNLSYKAKGIYMTILRYITLDNWELSKSHLIKHSKDGEKAFDSGWKELKNTGYLKQYRIPDKTKRGKFTYEYELLDEADTSTPSLINCTSDGEEMVIDHTPQKGPYAKRTICKKDGMLKGPYAKGGIYNNTDTTNTELNNTNITNTNIIEYFWRNRVNLDADSIDLLSDQVKMHGEDTVKKAVDAGTKNGTKVVRYKYVEEILKNCSVNGVPEDKEEKRKKIFDF